jgi:hypothetical protein
MFRAPFQWVMAFGQLDLQPSCANAFLMDTALHWFIYERSPISGMLSNHQTIGSHTDVYFFYCSGSITRLTWSHPGLRPFGTPLAVQCQCKTFKSWTPKVKLNKLKDDIQSVTLVCRHCKHSVYYLKPANIRRVVNRKYERSEVGDWYMEDVA